jgi:hypothetical protein
MDHGWDVLSQAVPRRVGITSPRKIASKRSGKEKVPYIYPSHFSTRLSSAICGPIGKIRQGREAGPSRFVKKKLMQLNVQVERAASGYGFSHICQVISQAHLTKAAFVAKAVDGEGAENH